MFVARMTGAAALLALSTGIAAAVPAPLDRTANVRAGPGTNYPVVATLRRGTVVDVEGCSGAWCVIDWSGGQGYVARSVLALGDAPPAVAVVPGPTYYYDDYPGFDYPGYALAPGVGVDVGHRWRHRHWRGRWHDRPGRPDWAGRPGRPDWTGRPSQPGMVGPAGPAGKSFGQVGRPGFGGGAAIGGGGRATVGGAPAAAAPAPAASAPAAPAAGPAGKR
jgi:uncharacterized protein YraI